MRPRVLSVLVVLLGAVVAMLGLVDCLGPTEITLVLQTNVPCKHWNNATITVGSPADVETKAPVTSTTTCDAQGNLGTLVVVPSGSDTAEVAIKVVGGEDRDPNTCLAPAYGAGCIVARRQLPYLKHTPLRLIILLESSCDGIECAAPLTCSGGKCVSDEVNPSACVGSGCNASVLSPVDAGREASVRAHDAGTDVHLGAPPTCGDVSGLQTGAAWPMRAYCPTHQGRSPFVGPQTPTLKWKGPTGGLVSGLPAIGADGTVYVGSNDRTLHAFAPDGGSRWAYATGGNINNPAPAIAANGSLTFPSSDTFIYNVTADGGLRWKVSTADQVISSPAIDRSGKVFIGGGVPGSSAPLAKSLLALTLADGGIAVTYPTGGGVDSSPAIGVDGTVYFGSEDGSLYAVAPGTSSVLWSTPLGGPVGSPTLGDDGTIYVLGGGNLNAVTPLGKITWTRPTTFGSTDVAVGADGTLYYVGSGGDGGASALLYAVSPSGTERWSVPAGTRTDFPPSIGADGTVYVASFDSNVYAFTSSGTLRWKFATGGYLNSAIALGDHVLYVGSSDTFLYAIGP